MKKKLYETLLRKYVLLVCPDAYKPIDETDPVQIIAREALRQHAVTLAGSFRDAWTFLEGNKDYQKYQAQKWLKQYEKEHRLNKC